MFEEDEDEEEEVKFGADMLKNKAGSPQIKEEEAESYVSIETATEDKIETESLHSSFGELHLE